MYIYICIFVCVCVGARHPMFAGVSFVRGAILGYCTQVTVPRCGFCTPGIVMSLYTTLCRTLFVKGWEKPCDGTMAGVLWRIGQQTCRCLWCCSCWVCSTTGYSQKYNDLPIIIIPSQTDGH